MNLGYASIWRVRWRKCALALVTLLSLDVSAAHAQSISYLVAFKGSVVATQQVQITYSDGLLTTRSSFSAPLVVFVAHHEIAEELGVSCETNGTVTEFRADIREGAKFTTIRGETGADGVLRVVRSDRNGVMTNYIARADYDFNSLTMYGNAPTNFLPTNSTVRVLDIAQGKVVPVTLSVIGESYTTRERQDVPATHVVWSEGAFVSHSWHPERFSNLPVRYIRQNDLGEFTFSLQR